MAYNPTVWEENDLLSIDRMNKIEQGIAAASATPDGLLPAGGTTGQMLTKASDDDFDVEWSDVAEGSSGGSILTVEDQIIDVPSKIATVFGTMEVSGVYILKNVTIVNNEFKDDIVLFQLEHSVPKYQWYEYYIYTMYGVKYHIGCYDGEFDINRTESFTYNASTNEFDEKLLKNLSKSFVEYSKFDNFFEVYGLDKQNATEQISLVVHGSSGHSISISNTDTISDVINRSSFSNDPKMLYDKATGKIVQVVFNYEDKTTTVFTVKVKKGNVELTPTPIPASFVTSFNSRSGDIIPQSGDYTASMVGAIPASAVTDIVVLTEEEHTALTDKPSTTLYLIPEE